VNCYRINAEKAPFLTNKLRVTVLPTLALFLDGVAVNYIIGFQRLGNEDNFKTETLANLLFGEKVLCVGVLVLLKCF
jgi:thioredoxin-like negative regulator of GroEL